MSSTAVDDIDGFGSTTLFFNSLSETRMCLNTTITEDDDREPVETFIITTSIIAGDATLITPIQRTISLIDRDCK